MRRLLPLMLASLLVPTLAAPAAAAGSFTQFTPVHLGAYRNGETWTPQADCLAGYAGAIEFRCGWEFNLDGIPFGQIITHATLQVTRTAGDCSANNCPVLLNWFQGNGGADVSDVLATSSAAFSWTPTDSSSHSFNVLDQIRDHYAAGHAWAGFNLRASSNYGLYQYFDPKSISLEVAYGQAVTVLIEPFFNGGTGKVTSSPSGLNCPDICGRDFADGTKLTLTATPDAGSAFSEWRTGPCAHSTKLTCSFDVPLSDVTVAVTFVAATAPTPAPTQKASPHPTATAPVGGSVAPSAAPTRPAASAGASAAPTGAAPSADASGAASGDGATPSVTEAGPLATAGATATPGPGAASSNDGGVPLPIIVLLLIVAIVVGGGGFWLGTRRRKPTA